jgi:hypothetical protein
VVDVGHDAEVSKPFAIGQAGDSARPLSSSTK